MAPSAAPAPKLRADAVRSIQAIREAALEIFRQSGLAAPLDEIAKAAGVSKGTIYHRFGDRDGLVDAVVEELVVDCVDGITASVEAIDDPLERFEAFLRQLWMLQFDAPAANDVILRAVPGSPSLVTLCDRIGDLAERLLAQAQQAGVIQEDITAEDLRLLIWERGVMARACDQQSRDAYARRMEFALRGLRAA